MHERHVLPMIQCDGMNSFRHKSCLNDKNECFDYVRRQNGIFCFCVVCWCDTIKHESEPFNLNDNIKYIFSWITFMLSERLNGLCYSPISEKEIKPCFKLIRIIFEWFIQIDVAHPTIKLVCQESAEREICLQCIWLSVFHFSPKE